MAGRATRRHLWHLCRITLVQMLAARLLWVWAALLGLSASGAGFVGLLALSETDTFRAAAYAGPTRLLAAALLGLSVVLHTRQSEERGEVSLLLGAGVAPWQYVLGRWCGFALGALLMVLLAAGLALGFGDWPGVLCWALGLLLELCLVAAAALFAGLALGRPLPAVAWVGGYYLLARAGGVLAGLAAGQGIATPGPWQAWFSKGLGLVRLLLPRLDRLTDGAWLWHGSADLSLATYGPVVAHTFTIVGVLLLAAMMDFGSRTRNR